MGPVFFWLARKLLLFVPVNHWNDAVSQTEIFTALPEVVACELETGAALLDLRTSTYFSLNSVGSVLWDALQTPSSADSLATLVADHFEITPEKCRADVEAYLNELHSRQLVTRVQG